MLDSVKLHADSQMHCKTCSLALLCLPGSVSYEEIDLLDDIVKHGRQVKKDEFLFRQGDSFNAIYVIRSGALKSFSVSKDGEEQILGLHLPGELIGLSGMGAATYPISVRALDNSEVCELPFDALDAQLIRLPKIRRHLIRAMSREIRNTQQMTRLLTKKAADPRVASLLVDLAERFSALGYSANQLHLSISRNDIGNYLGLAGETVSRVFTRLQQNGLIEVEGKEVRIIDPVQMFN
ncbi:MULTISPECIES: fumarate/nitrate reduction transcriptional regulator Fnr [Pseudomonas]|uniref:Fumarate/nitrate reduction transcriptional regulator Fnr n=1 Tax=Pseudomonas sp. Hg7Tf TaxID=3236988 RepID=A0AB39I9S5_9PSED|nr:MULTISPECIES: fumarate/nitrate reduction transcriptional regulator Fnr [Pseudomonas]KJK05885.1 transcriptional regulator [Pseudomonas sp. 5]MDD1978919.1 fumarate/nitrate reduction transcriptional regulator Fnr [Pseudomonas putida]MDH2558888.1 fumarate/nitrate reduction transcriptional regulator Fnr [Pseudomonas sp. Hg5Tf]QYX50328.1 fumarate/nitrate reduction transcriptional regulator Fnr [Pseudomonas sp. S11A 273]